jgi:hypothetical protein
VDVSVTKAIGKITCQAAMKTYSIPAFSVAGEEAGSG